MLRVHISKSKRCFNVKSSTYYFHMKKKILADFQICISVPLRFGVLAIMLCIQNIFITLQHVLRNVCCFCVDLILCLLILHV